MNAIPQLTKSGPGSWLVIHVAQWLLCLCLWSLSAQADDALIEAVSSVGISVTDLERSIVFYRDVLDFEMEGRYEVSGEQYERLYGVFGLRMEAALMSLGDEKIELMQFLAPAGRPVPSDSRSNDRWFQHIAIITSDMELAYQRLRQHRVAHASSGPQTLPDWNPNAGGIKAFYFRDPDGNHLEILQFPQDKGDAKWRVENPPMFQGIDHTAIVVANTDASLGFYRDLFGLQVAGASENYGPEQERLNNVFGARLRITALRAARGPGVELLEYLAPAGGRPMPPDTLASDLWHWQINLRTGDVQTAWDETLGAQPWMVSPDLVTLADRQAGFSRGMMVRDPDGHASLVSQP